MGSVTCVNLHRKSFHLRAFTSNCPLPGYLSHLNIYVRIISLSVRPLIFIKKYYQDHFLTCSKLCIYHHSWEVLHVGVCLLSMWVVVSVAHSRVTAELPVDTHSELQVTWPQLCALCAPAASDFPERPHAR